MTRDPGFYWLFDLEGHRTPTVAQWSGEDWQFIGSLWIVTDDELDSDGDRVMARYRVGDRIADPVP